MVYSTSILRLYEWVKARESDVTGKREKMKNNLKQVNDCRARLLMETFHLENEPLAQLAVVWMIWVGLYFFQNGKGFLRLQVF